MGQAAHHYLIFETAAGFCGIAWSAAGITRFQLPTSSTEATERILLRRVPGAAPGTPTPEIAETIVAVKRYFDGEETDFSAVTLDLGEQDAFFAHGVQFLRPLNLKTVADAIGMHESTVSRVTANKYMATSRGIFELKYFFTSSINASDGGEAHSAEAVRHRIKQLIDAESAQDVLSDDTIVERLREAGIDIARRTVAKYREAMRIPSSVQRRREKQSLAGAAS